MSFCIDNFEIVYGTKVNIQTLRDKVLELAIQGKLVEQDANDESASELINKIKAEKDKLVKEGKIKKQKPFRRVNKEEVPFEIPNSWVWVRLGEVTNYGNNVTLTPDNINVNDWVLELEDIEKNSSKILKVILNKERKSKSNKNKFFKGDVLYGKLRPYLKKVIVAPNDGVCTTEIVAFRGYSEVSSQYLLNYLKSPYVDSYVNSITYGMNMPRLGTEDAKELLLPLPSINEQHRIVDKIETLMSEIDKLEENLQKKEHIKKLLPEAVVDVISKCQNGEELKEQLQFIIDNFDTIFQTPQSMQELRNVILQLAIEGKLVPQDKNDEPAFELIKRIKIEKDKLVKEGKIKTEKQMPEIEDDEIHFKIPENWEWVRLGEISEYIQRGKSPKYSLVEEYPVIAQKCIQWTGVSLEKALFIEPNSIEKYGEERFLCHGDILWNSTGTGSCGRVGVFTDSIRNGYEKIVADSHVTVVRCCKTFIDFEYLFIWLKSPEVQSVIESKASGSTNQIELATSTIKEYVISLPPLEEQHRIVQKVESFMKLIDQMENKLKRKNILIEKMASV